MITRRIILNLIVFLGLSFLLVYTAGTQLVFQKGGGRTLALDFTDAAGLAPRNDVTMRGVPVGAVHSVTLTPQGVARVVVTLQPGITVPAGTKAEITRRSPIGDLTLELTPGTGATLPNGALIHLADTTPPPDPEKTIADLAMLLHAVPSQDLGSLVSTLATALRGRGQDLATLSVATADLPERILQVRAELESLIVNGPKVADVFAQNAGSFADDLSQTAALADILRDRRYDLVKLSTNGAAFAQVANQILASQKPNIACLITDFGTVNATLAQPNNLANLETTLELNHYFFDAVWQSVQPGKDGLDWFRVHMLPAQQPAGQAYNPMRPPPDVYGGDACRSIYGPGVGPGTQPGPVWLATGSKLHRGT